MNQKQIILLIFFVLVMPVIFAGDITFSLDQNEYFFKTGENAVIILQTDNSYETPVNGMLNYTITQSINQGNLQYSSSNTQSTPFTVEEGINSVPLDFGSSDSPTNFSVDLKFSYDKNETREVVLESIKIYFVSDENQKNNQQNPVSSSSQKPQESSQQDSFAQQEQKMQQMINQMNQNIENQNNQMPQNTEQKLQNNQLPQDSSALKQQMEEQAKEQQKKKEELLEKIKQNPEYQKFDKQLQEKGFKQQNTEFSQDKNKTTVEINYSNDKNENAVIKAEIDQNKVKKIELVQKNKQNNQNYFLLLLIAVLLLLLVYFAYRKFSKKPKKEIIERKNVLKPINHKAEALKMLEKAEKLFEEKEYKEAYGKAGQALRLYLSHENGLKKEITNDEIIEFLKKQNKSWKKAKDCFDYCSLVEFAKYKANKKDFEKIIEYAKKIIK